jgi:hypothetical protein
MTSVYFATTCKGRTQHLEQTLPANLHDNPKAKIVLVNYNSPDHLDDFIKKNHSKDIDSGRLFIYRFCEPGPFRMAHAKNLAHRLALEEGGETIVNMDADNLAATGFDEYVIKELTDADGNLSCNFLWAHMKKGEMRRGISGRIAVTKHAFMDVGGYDEVYREYGPDDKDMNLRLRRLGFEAREIDRRFLDAVPHNDKMRFKEYPHLRNAPVVEDFVLPGREHIRIANMTPRGLDVGCGVVYKNFGRDPIELYPLPTRIFGIGMQKTATTSLNKALIELGYDSAHWKSAHWAKAIWDEMRRDGRSLTLEKSYAVCDLPIPLLFRELDVAYPGSKFILTTRNEDDWIESVRTHFSAKNPFRSQWDSDPFTHKIHIELYGRRKFDEQVMRARYRRHNAEVREYFKGRSQDLLVMDMSGGAGWYELCGFLRRRIPAVTYPTEFVSNPAQASP